MEWTEYDLNRLFEPCRLFYYIYLEGFINTKLIVSRDTGISAGYGFIEFATHEDAAVALANLNGKLIRI